MISALYAEECRDKPTSQIRAYRNRCCIYSTIPTRTAADSGRGDVLAPRAQLGRMRSWFALLPILLQIHGPQDHPSQIRPAIGRTPLIQDRTVTAPRVVGPDATVFLEQVIKISRNYQSALPARKIERVYHASRLIHSYCLPVPCYCLSVPCFHAISYRISTRG